MNKLEHTNHLVSVIIPAYNASGYIADTIKSVLNQSYVNWELIIVDDGSKDNTSVIIHEYTSDARVHYYYQQNQGVSAARNYGISKAKGEYIAFLDADDIWKKNNLEIKVNILQNASFDFVFGDVQLMDYQGQCLDQFLVGIEDNFLYNALLWNGCVLPNPSSNLLIKKHCFLNPNIRFDPRFSTAADQDFVFYLCHYFKGARIPQVLVQYRNTPNSMSKNIALMEKDHIAVFRKAKDRKLFFGFWHQQQSFSNLYLILAGSWYKDGGNLARAIYFVLRSVIVFPLQIVKIMKLIFQKIGL